MTAPEKWQVKKQGSNSMTEMILSPKQAMQLALKEAEKGLGFVEPNPPVGCVVLDSEHRFLSSGFHEKYGGDHAEVSALKKIKDKNKLKGGHVFVTLEPCHHEGKTSPCSLELAKYPIQSLTYGTEDPFTKKQGLDYLLEKGIKVIRSFDFQKELEDLIAPFKFSVLNKKSFVSLKIASSIDGTTALETGESQWITGEASRKHGHFLRARHSAVLIGLNTLLKDNPQLNIRVDPFKEKKNKVVILDPEGKSFSFLLQSNLLKMRSSEDVIVCCLDKVKKNKLGVNQLSLPSPSSFRRRPESKKASEHFESVNIKYRFSLPHLLEILYQDEKIQSVLVEGGAFCWSEFLRQKVAQKLYLYMAPKIMGKGLRWSKDFTLSKLSDSRLLDSITFQHIGDDLLIEGVFR